MMDAAGTTALDGSAEEVATGVVSLMRVHSDAFSSAKEWEASDGSYDIADEKLGAVRRAAQDAVARGGVLSAHTCIECRCRMFARGSVLHRRTCGNCGHHLTRHIDVETSRRLPQISQVAMTAVRHAMEYLQETESASKTPGLYFTRPASDSDENDVHELVFRFYTGGQSQENNGHASDLRPLRAFSANNIAQAIVCTLREAAPLMGYDAYWQFLLTAEATTATAEPVLRWLTSVKDIGEEFARFLRDICKHVRFMCTLKDDNGLDIGRASEVFADVLLREGEVAHLDATDRSYLAAEVERPQRVAVTKAMLSLLGTHGDDGLLTETELFSSSAQHFDRASSLELTPTAEEPHASDSEDAMALFDAAVADPEPEQPVDRLPALTVREAVAIARALAQIEDAPEGADGVYTEDVSAVLTRDDIVHYMRYGVFELKHNKKRKIHEFPAVMMADAVKHLLRKAEPLLTYNLADALMATDGDAAAVRRLATSDSVPMLPHKALLGLLLAHLRGIAAGEHHVRDMAKLLALQFSTILVRRNERPGVGVTANIKAKIVHALLEPRHYDFLRVPVAKGTMASPTRKVKLRRLPTAEFASVNALIAGEAFSESDTDDVESHVTGRSLASAESRASRAPSQADASTPLPRPSAFDSEGEDSGGGQFSASPRRRSPRTSRSRAVHSSAGSSSDSDATYSSSEYYLAHGRRVPGRRASREDDLADEDVNFFEAPPLEPRLGLGEHVMVQYKGRRRYFLATVKNLHRDQSADIVFLDAAVGGISQKRVMPPRIRRPTSAEAEAIRQKELSGPVIIRDPRRCVKVVKYSPAPELNIDRVLASAEGVPRNKVKLAKEMRRWRAFVNSDLDGTSERPNIDEDVLPTATSVREGAHLHHSFGDEQQLKRRSQSDATSVRTGAHFHHLFDDGEQSRRRTRSDVSSIQQAAKPSSLAPAADELMMGDGAYDTDLDGALENSGVSSQLQQQPAAGRRKGKRTSRRRRVTGLPSMKRDTAGSFKHGKSDGHRRATKPSGARADGSESRVAQAAGSPSARGAPRATRPRRSRHPEAAAAGSNTKSASDAELLITATSTVRSRRSSPVKVPKTHSVRRRHLGTAEKVEGELLAIGGLVSEDKLDSLAKPILGKPTVRPPASLHLVVLDDKEIARAGGAVPAMRQGRLPVAVAGRRRSSKRQSQPISEPIGHKVDYKPSKQFAGAYGVDVSDRRSTRKENRAAALHEASTGSLPNSPAADGARDAATRGARVAGETNASIASPQQQRAQRHLIGEELSPGTYAAHSPTSGGGALSKRGRRVKSHTEKRKPRSRRVSDLSASSSAAGVVSPSSGSLSPKAAARLAKPASFRTAQLRMLAADREQDALQWERLHLDAPILHVAHRSSEQMASSSPGTLENGNNNNRLGVARQTRSGAIASTAATDESASNKDSRRGRGGDASGAQGSHRQSPTLPGIDSAYPAPAGGAGGGGGRERASLSATLPRDARGRVGSSMSAESEGRGQRRPPSVTRDADAMIEAYLAEESGGDDGSADRRGSRSGITHRRRKSVVVGHNLPRRRRKKKSPNRKQLDAKPKKPRVPALGVHDVFKEDKPFPWTELRQAGILQ